jgi:hypothetical protein
MEDCWKFCAKLGPKLDGCNFYVRYDVTEESFEQVFWYYGAYCAMEGCVLLIPGGGLEGYFKDTMDDSFVAMIKGSWHKDESARQYVLTYEKVAVDHRGGSCLPQLVPLSECPAWKSSLASSISISCDDVAPSGLPELHGSKFLTGRYELGSRIMHGN